MDEVSLTSILCLLQAQFLIFEKLREEGYGVGVEDVRLTVEIVVPSSQVSTHTTFMYVW